MSDTADEVTQDELQIRRLLERYMRYDDDRDLDAMLSVFAPDATYRVAGGVYHGHEEIEQFLASVGYEHGRPAWTDPGQLMVMPRSTHVMSNPVIGVSNDQATAETDFVVLVRDAGGHGKVQLLGRYRDRLVRTTNGWQILERTGVSLARETDPPGREEPAPRPPA
jgi:3-phenylpropionate/cinnamic acid dioxygenase small subunit